MKKHLPAGADNMVWIVTGSFVALTAFIIILTGTIENMPAKLQFGLRITAIVFVLIQVTALLARPLMYEVRDSSIAIIRSWPLSTVIIPKSEIKEVRHVRLGKVMPIPPVAIGWIFGYAGRFRTGEQGSVVMYGSNPAHAALIEAKRKYIVTPANPKRFINDVLGRK